MLTIAKARHDDISALVWLARKSHASGPFATLQFQPGRATAELSAAIHDANRLLLVVKKEDVVGFVYCKVTRPRFVRECFVELLDTWIESTITPHEAAGVKLWLAVSSWSRRRQAESIVWRNDRAMIPAQALISLRKLGLTTREEIVHGLTL